MILLEDPDSMEIEPSRAVAPPPLLTAKSRDLRGGVATNRSEMPDGQEFVKSHSGGIFERGTSDSTERDFRFSKTGVTWPIT